MLRKKEVYTTITPIPGYIPRQLGLDILHAHSEVITLNPLVLEHKAIPAPRNAAAEEFYCTWYEITERIQYVPGTGRMGSGQIKFNGCFHDLPWGLQTHIYAPFNIDLRICYRIGGNQPGVEPPEPREIGMEKLKVPMDGLYLREDIEIRCNIAMVGFVKSQQKAASKEMVTRMIKKAELLDAGVLQAMMEGGRLKTINPNDRSKMPAIPSPTSPSPNPSAVPNDPRFSYMTRTGTMSDGQAWPRPDSTSPQASHSATFQQQQQQQYPPTPSPSYPPYARPGTGSSTSHSQPSPGPYGQYPYQVPRSPSFSQQQYPGMQQHQQAQTPPVPPLPPSYSTKEQTVSVELPADMHHPVPPGYGQQPPQQQYAAELPAHSETAEEHQGYAKR